MDRHQSTLDTLGCSVWQQAKTTPCTRNVVGRTPAFGICHPTCIVLVLPNFLCSLSRFPLYVLFFFSSSSSLSFQRASLASDLSFTARASCLTLPLSPPVCVLNHNPANPTSNGVYWERYQTWPLGLALWPSYSHEKQGFNTICLTAFSEPAVENHQIFKYTGKWFIST